MSKTDTSDPAAALLIDTLTDLVAEMVEAKCATLSARERGTLQRRIAKAVDLFVKGMQLSPAQRRANEARRRTENK